MSRFPSREEFVRLISGPVGAGMASAGTAHSLPAFLAGRGRVNSPVTQQVVKPRDQASTLAVVLKDMRHSAGGDRASAHLPIYKE